MTQKYFELLDTCKKVSPEVKERLEKIKPGCIWKNIYGPDGKLTEIGSIETIVSPMKGGNFYSRVGDFEIHFPHSSQIKEILGHLTIAQYVELFNEVVALIGNTLYSVILYDSHHIDNFLIEFESGKELFEQSEETLQRCINLIKEVYGIV